MHQAPRALQIADLASPHMAAPSLGMEHRAWGKRFDMVDLSCLIDVDYFYDFKGLNEFSNFLIF